MDEAQESRLFELADLILAVGRQLHAAKAHDDRHGGADAWTPLESAVMRFIDAHPGTTAGAVAEATHQIASNFSRALRGLERRGLVRREADEGDARRVRLFPTDEARENLRRLHGVWSRLLDGAVAEPVADGLIETLRNIEAELTARERKATSGR
jgi:DNA-binding MarR family transcriptional regulator